MHGTAVADGGEQAVAHAVEHREAEAHQRDVFGAGDVLAVGVAEDQLHRLDLDALVEFEEIRGVLDHGLGELAVEDFMDAVFKRAARRSGEDVFRIEPEFHREAGHAHHHVRIAEDGDGHVVEILADIRDGIQQAAAFGVDGGGHLDLGDATERVDVEVGVHQADGGVEFLVGHLAFLQQLLRRRVGGELAEGEGLDGIAHAPDLGHRRAALGIHLVNAGLGKIEHVRGVRAQGELHAELVGEPLELAHVAGVEPAGHDVDAVGGLAGLFRQVVDDAGAHVGEAGDVRADEARGIAMDHRLAFRDLALVAGLLDDGGNVIADDLREAGGVDGDDFRIIDREDVDERLLQVGHAAEDRGSLGERAGGGGDRFLEVAREVTAVIGAATL